MLPVLAEVFFDIFTGKYSALNITGSVVYYHYPVKTSKFPHFNPLVISEVFFLLHILNSNYQFITLLANTNSVKILKLKIDKSALDMPWTCSGHQPGHAWTLPWTLDMPWTSAWTCMDIAVDIGITSFQRLWTCPGHLPGHWTCPWTYPQNQGFLSFLFFMSRMSSSVKSSIFKCD